MNGRQLEARGGEQEPEFFPAPFPPSVAGDQHVEIDLGSEPVRVVPFDDRLDHSSLAPGAAARRQAERIVVQRSSSQSWSTCLSR